jgi:hypothetical protein
MLSVPVILTTLQTDDPALSKTPTTKTITLAPYATYIAELK